MDEKVKRAALILWALLVAGCATTAPQPATIDAIYDHAMVQAGVWRPQHLRELKPVVPDANGEVVVVTLKGEWVKWENGPMQAERDIWVTVVPEVQERCRAFTGDKPMRLRQLLGLTPTQNVTWFYTIRANAKDLFRPTPSKATDTVYPCLDVAQKQKCNEFPQGEVAHRAWMGNQFLTLQMPGGYPWTHMGYTLDWAPGADRYGASEYVIPAGAAVKVEGKSGVEEYCR